MLKPFFPLFVCLVTSYIIFSANSTVQTIDPNGVGTDLYFAKAITQGQIPLRDFNDIYGPLMNYYNALCMRLSGFDLHSLITGKIFLRTIASGLFFLAASRIMPALFALVASLAFTVFTPDFSHNIKSYGIICLESGILWAILSYFISQNKKYILGAAAFILLLGLIKINFGAALLGSSFISFILFDLFKYRKPWAPVFSKYGLLSVLIIAFMILIYYFHLKGLSLCEVQQSLPFLNAYAYKEGSLSDGLINFIKNSLLGFPTDPFLKAVKFIWWLAIIRLIVRMHAHYSCTARWTSLHRDFALITTALLLGLLVSNHEFYVGGADYESFYSRPFSVMLIAYFISEAALISGKIIETFMLIFFSMGIITNAYGQWKGLDVYKDPAHFFKYKGVNAYVTNDPRDMQTMMQTADYINEHLSPQETFFAFPNDAVYYFLTGRSSPSRLVFLLHVENINEGQQIDLINALEKKGNKYVVLDNICYFGRAFDDYGVFGQNNCLLLDKYIKKYFVEVAGFGNVPGANVGTKIFKRKASLFVIIRKPGDLN